MMSEKNQTRKGNQIMNKPTILRFVLSLPLQTMLFCLLANVAMGQTEEVKNRTSNEFSKDFDALVEKGYRPVKIWCKQLGTFDSVTSRFGYWGTFKKDPNAPNFQPDFQAVFGKKADTYQQSFNKWTGQGFTPTYISVGCVGSTVRYCAIFEKIPNPTVARHNMNNATFQKENATWTRQGYKLLAKSSCNEVYAAIWQK
jgi:Bacterial tandem repeat domain 1